MHSCGTNDRITIRDEQMKEKQTPSILPSNPPLKRFIHNNDVDSSISKVGRNVTTYECDDRGMMMMRRKMSSSLSMK